MEEPHVLVPGIVQNGVVVPMEKYSLPEGARVEIFLSIPELTPKLKAEFEDWERVGDEAWSLIDQWEKEPHLMY